MIDYSGVFDAAPFNLDKDAKHLYLTEILKSLTIHHYRNCGNYKKIIDAFGHDINGITSFYDVPFIPVRIFKEFEMRSVSEEAVFKTMTSSGTSVQEPSKIYVDRTTSLNQTKIMGKIVSSFLSATRLPMIIIDTESVLSNRFMFSARGGAILGFSLFSKERLFALDENMQLRKKELTEFINKHKNSKMLIFGFTYIIWLHFYKELLKKDIEVDLSNGILIHGGGWKRLAEQAVTKTEFKESLLSLVKIKRVYDYYGMVEQASSIYMECEYGKLHASSYSDIIIRRSKDFSVAAFGEPGIIQAVSVSPYSYPGHSVLTEDIGIIHGEDDCQCGRMGKYVEIVGRIEKAETRGCSDTYESGR